MLPDLTGQSNAHLPSLHQNMKRKARSPAQYKLFRLSSWHVMTQYLSLMICHITAWARDPDYLIFKIQNPHWVTFWRTCPVYRSEGDLASSLTDQIWAAMGVYSKSQYLNLPTRMHTYERSWTCVLAGWVMGMEVESTGDHAFLRCRPGDHAFLGCR